MIALQKYNNLYSVGCIRNHLTFEHHFIFRSFPISVHFKTVIAFFYIVYARKKQYAVLFYISGSVDA